MTTPQPNTTPTTQQARWTQADSGERQQFLKAIGDSTSFAASRWRDLPHITKANLTALFQKM